MGGGRLVAMNLAAHAPAWFKPGQYVGTPAIAGGIIYAIIGGAVQAYQSADGISVGTYIAIAPDAYTPANTIFWQPIITNDLSS